MKNLLLLLLAGVLSGCASTWNSPPLETVDSVDLERYMGEWYVIANIPYFGERGNVAGRAIYRMREDGRMDDIYLYRDGDFDAPEERLEGVAWVVDEDSNARWKVRFYWPLTFAYYIVDLDPDYQWSLVGHPSRNYAWIMARAPRIDDELYEQLLARFEELGFDSSDLKKVPQFPDQIGQPGFQ
ncbi:lipocalin family protein [Wenzhouxiangella limi]|uniref:Outer membrane lipoprotein Blc n=1 Tax=Wenzhouxiangella limi TaxID=2707351 RepID=A0A845V204_9GAMM|nr:lipocalin family protein [Wenzhouxiangella limi]NDY94311.1 lipocalin family protein [Wenzhouxiangella limi]